MADYVGLSSDVGTQRGALLPSLELVPTLRQEPGGAVRVYPELKGCDWRTDCREAYPGRTHLLDCNPYSLASAKDAPAESSEKPQLSRILAPPRKSKLVTRGKKLLLFQKVRPPRPPSLNVEFARVSFWGGARIRAPAARPPAQHCVEGGILSHGY